MYEPTEGVERQLGHDAAQVSSKPVPRMVRYGATQFGWRHVKRVAVIRLLVAIWLVILGSIFCALGHWWGALLFVPAGLVGWLAYQVPRWKRALDAEMDLRVHAGDPSPVG
jgi:hypothetical protein